MKTRLEDRFFGLFDGIGSVYCNCIFYVLEKYAPSTKKPKEWFEKLEKATIEEIRRKAENFDFGVLSAGRISPLLKEIEDNLTRLQTNEEKKRYIYKLLTPFSKWADVANAKARTERIKKDIERTKEDLKMWEEQRGKDERAEGQIKGCTYIIKKFKEELGRYEYKKGQYWAILGKLMEDEIIEAREERKIEYYAIVLNRAVGEFANRLDALLLMNGFDLLKIQKECGIYLKDGRNIFDVDFYVGSEEIARKYIEDINKADEGQQEIATQQRESQKMSNSKAKQVEAHSGAESGQRKAGRKVKDFDSCLLGSDEEKEETKKALHILLKGKMGKDVVLILMGAMMLGKMLKPTFGAVKKEFGYIGNRQNFNKYIGNKNAFSWEEIGIATKAIE